MVNLDRQGGWIRAAEGYIPSSEAEDKILKECSPGCVGTSTKMLALFTTSSRTLGIGGLLLDDRQMGVH